MKSSILFFLMTQRGILIEMNQYETLGGSGIVLEVFLELELRMLR